MKQWDNLQLSRRSIALNPTTGDSYRMNETASFILAHLQRGKSPHEIAMALHQDYEVTMESALSDVHEFIVNLNIQGIGE